MMKIKKFSAASIQEALSLVKSQMGEDALILGASRRPRQGRKGNRVEIVAAAGCKDGRGRVTGRTQDTVAVTEDKEIGEMRHLDTEIVQELRQIETRLKDILEKVLAPSKSSSSGRTEPLSGDLLEAGFDPLMLKGRITHLSLTSDLSTEALVRSLVRNIPIEESEARVSIFLGPSGSGKTTTVLKVAKNVYLPKRIKPRIVFFGGREDKDVRWLNSQCRKLGLRFSHISKIDKMAKLLRSKKKETILVDTPSVSDLGDEEMRFLVEASKDTEGMGFRLVIDATMDPWNICAIASCVPGSPRMTLVLTKLDEATRIGGAVSASVSSCMPVAYVTGGREIADGIYVPNEKLLSEKILDSVGSREAV
jgi:flagellar biosynthesis protein FlhF